MPNETSIPDGYCHCGCGGRPKIADRTRPNLGRMKGTSYRFIAGHNLRRSTAECSINAETGCWDWQGAKNSRGYGHLSVDGQMVYAHRRAYETAYGPIPDGLVVDHVCANPLCVNPDHLAAVSQAENVRRSRSTKLTVDDVRTIRRLAETVPQRQIAQRFGIAPNTVSSIVHRKRWIDID